MKKNLCLNLVKYCFWVLNNHLKLENFPKPNFLNYNVDGLFVRFYKNKKLRGSAGTTSKVNLLQGIKAYTINSASYDVRFDKITNPKELVCQVSILYNVVRINEKFNWVRGKHGIGAINNNNDVFLPGETLLRSKEQTILELFQGSLLNISLIRFETYVFEDSYFGSNPNPKTEYYLKLVDILLNYFCENEYETYSKIKKIILSNSNNNKKLKLDISSNIRVKNVLCAEFYNLHRIILNFQFIKSSISSNFVHINDQILIPKNEMMDFISNKIVRFGSVLENFKNKVEIKKINKFKGWNVYCESLSINVSYFFNLDKEMTLVKYLKFTNCYDIPFIKLSFKKKDFKQIPQNLQFPFYFYIFTLKLKTNQSLVFLYPDVALEQNLDFLLTVISEFDDIFTYQQKKKFDVVYIPVFTAKFKNDSKKKIYTINSYGVFEYENGIHEISENIEYKPENIEFCNKDEKRVLILNKPFVCFLFPSQFTTVIINPENRFKSKKQEKYMWKFHPKIAKKWEKRYGSLLKEKKKRKTKIIIKKKKLNAT